MPKQNDKRVTFYYTELGHKEFRQALKDYNVSQSLFFRIVMEGLVAGEPYITAFVKRKKKALDKKKTSGKKRQTKKRSSAKIPPDNAAYNETELENIFDLLERNGAIK
jgi:hypothetical protein